MTAQYVSSLAYVDALVARDRDTTGDEVLDERLWVQHDANFNVTSLLDASGSVVERYVYDPFGASQVYDATWQALSASGVAWQYRHQGLRLDLVTGTYYNRHREYSPSLGRFIQVDPIRFEAGDVNLYRYVGNGVTGRLDPSGLDAAVVGESPHSEIVVDLYLPCIWKSRPARDNSDYIHVGSLLFSFNGSGFGRNANEDKASLGVLRGAGYMLIVLKLGSSAAKTPRSHFVIPGDMIDSNRMISHVLKTHFEHDINWLVKTFDLDGSCEELRDKITGKVSVNHKGYERLKSKYKYSATHHNCNDVTLQNINSYLGYSWYPDNALLNLGPLTIKDFWDRAVEQGRKFGRNDGRPPKIDNHAWNTYMNYSLPRY